MLSTDYLVFHSRSFAPCVVRIEYPPHSEPAGAILDAMVKAAVPAIDVEVYGAIALPAVTWNQGRSLSLSVGIGKVGNVECTPEGWRVVL